MGAKTLAERGQIEPTTLHLLEVYAVHYGRWQSAEEHIAEYGAVVAAPRTGMPMHNPQLAVALRAADMVLKISRTLGFTMHLAKGGGKQNDVWSDEPGS